MAAGASRAGALVGALAATAVAVYVGATLVGGLLVPGYSHVSMHVSELTSSHAPQRALLGGIYIVYNLALGGAGLALLRSLAWSRWLAVASWSLVAIAVAGLLMGPFPQDSYGYPPTTAGTVHIVLAGVASLLIIVALVAAGRAFRADSVWASIAPISMVAALVMVLTGVAAALATAAESPYMGLAERLPIGTFLVWLVAVAWRGLRRPARQTHPPTAICANSKVG